MSKPQPNAQNPKSKSQNPKPVLSEAEGAKELCRLLFETASDAILVLQNGRDAGWVCVDSNASAGALFGCQPDELLGQTLLDFSPETQPDGQTSASALQTKIEVVLSGEKEQFEWLYQQPNGELRFAQVSLNRVDLEGDIFVQAILHDITQYKQTEAELHKLTRVVEQSANTIVITDTRGYIEYVNPKFTETTGYTRQEALGQHTRILKSGETSPEEYQALWATISAGKEWQGEFHNKKKNGELYWEFASISPIRDEQGHITHFLAIKEEITARKQAEEALRLSEARYREVVQNTNSMVLQFDSQGCVTFVNEFAQQFFGYAPEEILGQNIIGTIVPETESSGRDLAAMIQDLLQHPEQYVANENENIRRSGERVWVSWANKALFDEAGQLTEILCLGQDVTERKRLEQALQESERKLANIVDFLPYPTFAIDTAGKVIAWNQACETALGVKAEEILGQGDYEYALPFYGERRPILIDLVFTSPEEIEQNYTNVRRDGETLVGEAIVYPQGRERYFIGTAAPLYDAQGNVAGAIETFRDITEQKRAEEELRQYQDQLEELVEARTAELEDRVHELNALQRLMSREGWQEFQAVRSQDAPGYLFDRAVVRPVERDELELSPNGRSKAEESLEPIADKSTRSRAVTKPLAVSGESIGTLGIYDDPDNPLSLEDQAFLDEVASQVAEALERARLLEQVRAALTEAEGLYKAGQRISATGDLREMLAAVAEGVPVPVINRIVMLLFERDEADEIESVIVVATWYSGQGRPPFPLGARFQPQAMGASADILTQPEPVFCADIEQDERIEPGLREVLRPQKVRAMAVLPLKVGARQLGALTFEAEEAYEFTAREVRPYLSLAPQLAVAIENQHLFEQTQKRAAEQSVLNQVSLAILGEQDPYQIYQLVAQALVDDFKMSFARIWILDELSHELVLQVSAGEYTHLDGPHSRVSLNSGRKLAWIATERVPHITNDLLNDSRLDDKEWAKASNHVAFAGFPLIVGDELLGVMGMFSHKPIAKETQTVLQSLSVLVGTIVNTRRLFDQTQVALAEVEATQRRYTVQAWETYRRRKAVISHEQDREDVPPLGDELPPEVSQAVAQKKVLAISAVPALSAGADGGQAPSAGAKSSLVVPLAVRDEIIGVLGLQETAEARQWTPEEIALVEGIAEQVALAAEQIRLFDETQQRAAREKRVGEIGDKIRAAQSLEEALQVAIQEVGLSLKAPQTTVQLEVE